MTAVVGGEPKRLLFAIRTQSERGHVRVKGYRN